MSFEWLTIPLGDLCLKITDGAHNSPKTVSEGKPMASVKDLTRYGVDLSQARLIPIEDFNALVKQGCKPEVGDVLIAKDGNSALDTVCNVDRPLDAVLLSSVAILRPNPEKLDPHYLKHYLASSDVIAYLKANFISGAAIPRVVLKDFKKAVIKVPPLPIQRAISLSIDALDDRITLLHETNATLEAIAQALFKSWFVDFDPVRAKQEGRAPEGMDDVTAALFPDGFEESELGLVPRGWNVSSLASLMDIAGGTQPPASEFVETPRDGYIRLIQIRDYETDAHLTFVPHTRKLRTTTAEDIMIARYGASVGRICWGLDGAYNVALIRVVCDSSHREFLRTYLLSNVFQARLAAVSGRSAQAGFNKGDIASFKLTVPGQEALQAYQDHVWPLRETILHHRHQAQTVATLRDTLLPRLISGQLSLPEAESAVASAL